MESCQHSARELAQLHIYSKQHHNHDPMQSGANVDAQLILYPFLRLTTDALAKNEKRIERVA